MPIAKRAISEYLSRPIESLSWIKSLKEEQLDNEIALIDPPVKFTANLRLEQKACFFTALAYPSMVFMLDLGLGKTVISLEVLSYFYTNKFIRRAVVFAPTDELVSGWKDEINKFGFTIPYICLKGSSKEKWAQLENFKDGIIIGTYIGISAMVSELGTEIKLNGEQINKRFVDRTLVTDFCRDIGAVVFDQSTKISNRRSLSYVVGNFVSQNARIRMSLAGRAFGRDPVLLWAQFYLADRGTAFGNSITLFRESFYYGQKMRWGGIQWHLRKRREKILAQFCAMSSLRYSADECVTLPGKSYVKRVFEISDEGSRFYNDLLTQVRKNYKNVKQVKNLFLRTRQISSGFIGVTDAITDEKAQIVFKENPKLELLKQIIEELPEDRKIVIIYEFTFSGKLIHEMLTKMKIKHGWLWSGTTEWEGIKSKLNTDPEFRVLLANHRKGAMGLNLQAASYMCFYESPVGVIDRAECEGRIYRSGQTKKCIIIDMIAKGTVDDDILMFHQEGDELWKRIIDKAMGNLA